MLPLPSGLPGWSTPWAARPTNPAVVSLATAGSDKVSLHLSHHQLLTITIDWEFGHFRDCNGVSNGAKLDPQTMAREARAGIFTGNPAGLLGPRIKLRLVKAQILTTQLKDFLFRREQFAEVNVTDKRRPTTSAPTKQKLVEARRENRKFSLTNIGQFDHSDQYFKSFQFYCR